MRRGDLSCLVLEYEDKVIEAHWRCWWDGVWNPWYRHECRCGLPRVLGVIPEYKENDYVS